ncbi:hypothetical protein Tco_0156749 [Tanacetum coccineum]
MIWIEGRGKSVVCEPVIKEAVVNKPYRIPYNQIDESRGDITSKCLVISCTTAGKVAAPRVATHPESFQATHAYETVGLLTLLLPQGGGGEGWWFSVHTLLHLNNLSTRPFLVASYVRPTNAPLGAVELKRRTHPFMVQPYCTPTCIVSPTNEPWQVATAVAAVRSSRDERVVLVSRD